LEKQIADAKEYLKDEKNREKVIREGIDIAKSVIKAAKR